MTRYPIKCIQSGTLFNPFNPVISYLIGFKGKFCFKEDRPLNLAIDSSIFERGYLAGSAEMFF